MEEKENKPKKIRKYTRSAAKRLRDAKMVEMALTGAPIKEIAAELNVNRDTVGDVLKDATETKKILKQAEMRIHSLVGKAIDTVEAALDGRASDMTNGFKSALAVLKSVGVMKDKIDLTHSFPKPTIIRRRNGEEVILGSRNDEDDVA